MSGNQKNSLNGKLRNHSIFNVHASHVFLSFFRLNVSVTLRIPLRCWSCFQLLLRVDWPTAAKNLMSTQLHLFFTHSSLQCPSSSRMLLDVFASIHNSEPPYKYGSHRFRKACIHKDRLQLRKQASKVTNPKKNDVAVVESKSSLSIGASSSINSC